MGLLPQEQPCWHPLCLFPLCSPCLQIGWGRQLFLVEGNLSHHHCWPCVADRLLKASPYPVSRTFPMLDRPGSVLSSVPGLSGYHPHWMVSVTILLFLLWTGVCWVHHTKLQQQKKIIKLSATHLMTTSLSDESSGSNSGLKLGLPVKSFGFSCDAIIQVGYDHTLVKTR